MAGVILPAIVRTGDVLKSQSYRTILILIAINFTSHPTTYGWLTYPRLAGLQCLHYNYPCW